MLDFIFTYDGLNENYHTGNLVDNWNKEKMDLIGKTKKELWEKVKDIAVKKCSHNITIKINSESIGNKRVYRHIK